jgi:hypothetical protein
MANELEENSRLEPVVGKAIDLQWYPPPFEKEEEPEPKADPGALCKDGFTYEAYSSMVMKDIEDNYTISGPKERAIMESLKKIFLGRYSMDDIEKAVELANALLFQGLMAESSYGDCAEAEAELEKNVPGFSKKLYGSIIGYYGYINR